MSPSPTFVLCRAISVVIVQRFVVYVVKQAIQSTRLHMHMRMRDAERTIMVLILFDWTRFPL